MINNNLFAATQSGVSLSTNNGASWSSVNSGLTDSATTPLLVTEGNNLFASNRSGVFLSTNYGTTWTNVNSGWTDFIHINALSAIGNYLFAGMSSGNSRQGGSGVWRRLLSEMTTDVHNAKEQIPSYFVLSQNFPNPFNPMTTISYRLPVNSKVTLKVYDMLGREIQAIVNEQKGAGYYTATFDGSRLASGAYFYKLQAGSFSQTKKLMLLK